jgi:hypothetical protein
VSCDATAEQPLRAGQAFAADRDHFDVRPVAHDGHDRDHGVDWKVDVADVPAGLVDDRLDRDVHPFEGLADAVSHVAGERFEQVVVEDGERGRPRNDGEPPFRSR